MITVVVGLPNLIKAPRRAHGVKLSRGWESKMKNPRTIASWQNRKGSQASAITMTNPMRTARLNLGSVVLFGFMVFTVAALGQAPPAGKDKSAGQANPDAQAGAPKYKDASLSIEDRVADLLPRMTLEEKIDKIATGWENRIEVIDPTGTYTSEEAAQ